MDFKAILEKMAELDASKVSEECGMPMTAPQTPTAPPAVPPSMSINLNAQGLDSIESLMKLISKVNPDSLGGNVKEPTLPMMTTEPSMASLRDKVLSKPAIGIADGDIDPTDNDIDPEQEAFGNTPDGAPGPEIKPLSAAVPNGDDLHRKKGQYPATQPGDNPMAVESIKAQLEALLAEIKSK
jgi:hypothetical protein